MRTLFSLLMICACTAGLAAQTDSLALPAVGTELGLRGGYGYSRLRPDGDLDATADELTRASALSFGLFVSIPLGEVISLRPGLELNRRGTTVRTDQDRNVFGTNVPTRGEAKTRFTYVDVPLLLQAGWPTAGRLRPYVFAGVTLGYAIGGNLRTTASDIVEFNLMTADIDLEDIGYDRFHAAAVGGLGLGARLASGFGAFVEGRLERGLTTPYELPGVTAREGFNAFNIGAGVRFRL